MKKKIFGITLAVCLVVLSIASSTMAYFTDTTSKTQVFTSGNVDIEFATPTVFTDDESQTAQSVHPGEQIGNAAIVNNVGSEKAFIGIIISINKKMNTEAVQALFAGLGGANTKFVYTATDSSTTVYAYCDLEVYSGASVTFFNSVIVPAAWNHDEMAVFKDSKITVTAYATQTFGFVDNDSATNDAVIALKAAFPTEWSAVGN